MEEKLSQEYAVSRTPVHKAIEQLVEDGYLVRKNGRSVTVVEPNQEEFNNIMLLRQSLTKFAAIQAVQRISVEQEAQLMSLAEIADNVGLEDYYAYSDAEIKFHQYLIDCSQNTHMISISKSMEEKVRLCLSWFSSTYRGELDRVTSPPTTHVQLANALISFRKRKNLVPIICAVRMHFSMAPAIESTWNETVRGEGIL